MKKRHLILLLTIFITALSSVGHAGGVIVGTAGATYKIIEPDLLDEMQTKANNTNWGEYFNKDKIKKYMETYRHPNAATLPRAVRDQKRDVDVSYTLQEDLAVPGKRVVYPKGFTFNPLDYMSYPWTLVVIDGNDPDQVEWLQKSPMLHDINCQVTITEGKFGELSTKFRRKVTFISRQLAQRFDLRVVPSVVKQNGKKMEVSEIDVVAALRPGTAKRKSVVTSVGR